MTGSVEIEVSGWALGAFVGYLGLVVGIGVWAARFSSGGTGEFFIGGRSMGRFVVALSAVVSGRSAWLLLGVTGMAYVRGASSVWALVGYILVELVLFLTYARRLRRFTGKHGCITLPDFFAARFEDRDGRLRVLLIAVILIFMVAYVSSQLLAGGKAFSSGFGLDPTLGLLITAGIVLVYTALGGFLAVSVTDCVQAIIMLSMLVVLPVIVVMDLGGAGYSMEVLRALDPSMLDPFALGMGALVGFLGIGLGSPGNPHIVMRYMSIRDPEQLKWAAAVGTAWNVLLGLGALAVGLIGRAAYPEIEMLPGSDAEGLFPFMAGAYLPDVLYGLVLASIFAAIMSTADSQLLVGASSVSRDLYEKLIAKDRSISRGHMVLLSRLVVVILIAAALVLSQVAEGLIFALVLLAWAGLGAALGPTTILALYWRGTTRAGIAAGVVTGTVVTVLWYFTPALKGAIYELIPAFFASMIATFVVSLFGRPPAGARDMMEVMKGEEGACIASSVQGEERRRQQRAEGVR